jgi:hypothetical protein
MFFLRTINAHFKMSQPTLHFPPLDVRNAMLLDCLIRNCAPEAATKYVALAGVTCSEWLRNQPTQLYTLLQRYIASIALRTNAIIHSKVPMPEMYATLHFINARQTQNAFLFDVVVHIGLPAAQRVVGIAPQTICLEPSNHSLLESIEFAIQCDWSVQRKKLRLQVASSPKANWATLVRPGARETETFVVGAVCGGAAAATLSPTPSANNCTESPVYQGNYLFALLLRYRRECGNINSPTMA